MLKINGYPKLIGTQLEPNHNISNVVEYPNFYDITISNNKTAFTCLIGLRRESIGHWNGVKTYEILYNGKQIGNEVSADYISNIYNMLEQIQSVVKSYPC